MPYWIFEEWIWVLDLFRTIIGFVAPMMVLLIDYRDIDMKYVF